MIDNPLVFVGIGAMGRPMAVNMARAGIPVAVSTSNPVAPGKKS